MLIHHQIKPGRSVERIKSGWGNVTMIWDSQTYDFGTRGSIPGAFGIGTEKKRAMKLSSFPK